MLGKILKYDMAENLRFLLPVMAAALIVSAFTGYALGTLGTSAETETESESSVDEIYAEDYEELESLFDEALGEGSDENESLMDETYAEDYEELESLLEEDSGAESEENESLMDEVYGEDSEELDFLLDEDYEDDLTGDISFGDMILGLSPVVMIFVLGALAGMSIIIPIVVFFRSMFKERGYLTHGIPVSTHMLMLAKLLSCCLSALLGAIAGGLSVAVMACVLVLRIGAWDEAMSFFGKSVEVMMQYLSTSQLAALGAEVVTSSLLEGVYLFALLMLVIAFAMSFNKHRFLVGLISYVAVSLVVDRISALIGTLAGAGTDDLIAALDGGLQNVSEILSRITTVFAANTAIHVVMIAACYLGGCWMIRNRLNLD
ncbi:MAG: hypothetical protein K5840_07465 [Eubacterium sp.]|nr:hypothetical protein [Eubacterium sp.]